MSGLIPFSFDGREVRVVTDDAGQPWFVAADVAESLEYRMASDMTRNLDDDERGTQIVRTVGGEQEMSVISESGLYSAILKSRKAEAQRFRRWVTREVLPSIRKTGGYSAAGSPAAPRVEGAIQALKLAPLAMRAARAFGLDKNVAAISANQYVCTVTGHNLLKEFGATHLPAENQETQWFTPTELSPDAKVSARKLNEALAAAGLQERRGKVWELTPAGHAYARLFDTGKKHNSGVMVQQVKWAPTVLDQLRHTGSLL